MAPAVLGRLLTAMLTPFNQAGGLDYEAAQRLARLLVEDGSDGVVLAGTTGESPTLSDDEKIELVKRVREAIPGKDVVAGTGSNDTHHSIELSKRAMAAGADAPIPVANPTLRAVFARRGVDTPEKFTKFVTPRLADLHDAAGIHGIDSACERIFRAIRDGETIVIFNTGGNKYSD